MRHYKTLVIEGEDLKRLVNICLFRGINVKNIRIISDTEIMLQVGIRDYEMLQDAAGARYYIRVVNEGGYGHRIKLMSRRKSLIIGICVFVLILIYQSLFIAEIQVDGYESISEQDLRKSMKEAGLYEGCRKNVNLDKVKLHLYDDFDNISWIGIKYKGNLAQVSIAETEHLYQKHKVKKEKPCNIVADKSGYISNIDPEQGLRAVEDGAYVSKGDVIISGEVPLEKTTYDEESNKETVSYVHAEGSAEAKIPVRLNFYRVANEATRITTDNKIITISVNDHELFTGICPYKVSTVSSIDIINIVRPLKVKIQLNIIKEASIKTHKISQAEVKEQVINEIHKYVKEKLPDNTQILNKSLNFAQEKNIIRVGVTLETLQQIGIEEEIIVDKSNRQSDQNGDQ